MHFSANGNANCFNVAAYGKSVSYVGRVALVLHELEPVFAMKTPEEEVSVETLNVAIEFVTYAIRQRINIESSKYNSTV